mmetsp:Transcript_4762/g.7192  ORF Transcript_4762/g.7192 Transcript_4762/m.7192 type:complete len:148 (+) Transcript_4762:2396-2839(+)|eukprot:CAMPEP_0170503942 /NCGR_PEP_ID=MMETSP0208-20121228/46431_1 /TAXON_ID=197538 /ORGANISM="Strombidium inclinatum, Strain S3" /LENGTH=147 /DNA_ID=CAMNT_0010783895 /DNA_START=2923 /DNA_END=3366 /DNA_ORIENTATION=-
MDEGDQIEVKGSQKRSKSFAKTREPDMRAEKLAALALTSGLEESKEGHNYLEFDKYDLGMVKAKDPELKADYENMKTVGETVEVDEIEEALKHDSVSVEQAKITGVLGSKEIEQIEAEAETMQVQENGEWQNIVKDQNDDIDEYDLI